MTHARSTVPAPDLRSEATLKRAGLSLSFQRLYPNSPNFADPFHHLTNFSSPKTHLTMRVKSTSPLLSLPFSTHLLPLPQSHFKTYTISLEWARCHRDGVNRRTHFQASKFTPTQPNPKKSLRTPSQGPQTRQKEPDVEKSQAKGLGCAECVSV